MEVFDFEDSGAIEEFITLLTPNPHKLKTQVYIEQPELINNKSSASIKTAQKNMIEIIEYNYKYAADFKRLNLEWLDKYNLTEEPDLIVLDDPQGTVIGTGGAIYLAQADNKIIGTAALIHEHGGIFELAKMAVEPSWQGRGISRLLIEKCLEKAKSLGAKKIILFSNSQLQAAISLYSKYGFKHVDVTESPFLTADIKMELEVN